MIKKGIFTMTLLFGLMGCGDDKDNGSEGKSSNPQRLEKKPIIEKSEDRVN